MSPDIESFANWLTRFGEAEILLPAAAALALWMVLSTRSLRLVSCWLVPLAAAAVLTVVTKVAFIGWGTGLRSIDFTGVSGHTMFSTAIYPMLAYVLARRPPRPAGAAVRLAVGAAYGFAALVAWSRVAIHAHSVSEVLAAYVVGAVASGVALRLVQRTPPRPPPRWAAAALAGWFVVMPLHAAPSITQDLVTKIALRLSHHEQPFERTE